MDRTVVICKPDCLRRKLVGHFLSQLEYFPVTITDIFQFEFTEELCKSHYSAHVEKPFYPRLEKFMTSGPCIAILIEGNGCVPGVRALVENFRAMHAGPMPTNLLHASDGVDSGHREYKLFGREPTSA